MTPAKFFMLTDGNYSDYHVIGVYSTRAAAEHIRGVVGGDIEEVPRDPAVKELRAGLSHWSVLMLRDGTVEKVNQSEVSSYNLSGSVQVWRRSQAPAYAGKGTPDALMATVWAKDRKHAVKITNEIRSRFIAQGEWK